MNKKHIIDEIIRTAKENNGKPLGVNKFYSETGIKETDWKGIYWTKWSDALIEVGYKPNKMNEAYDEEFLIEKLINLIGDIKKFPTLAEIKFQSHKDKTFPSETTFKNRLKKKAEMAQKILDYCKDKSGYQDVIEICQKEIHESSEKEYASDTKEADMQFGYVYLMKLGRHYKIGMSVCVEKRNYEIGIKLPEKLKMIHKIKTDDPRGIEAYWHKRFENKKVRERTEWFDLSSSDISAFKRKKFM